MKNLRVKNQENSNKKVQGDENEKCAIEDELGLNALAEEEEDALQKDISENEIVFQNLISSIIPLLMIVINDPIKYKGLT